MKLDKKTREAIGSAVGCLVVGPVAVVGFALLVKLALGIATWVWGWR